MSTKGCLQNGTKKKNSVMDGRPILFGVKVFFFFINQGPKQSQQCDGEIMREGGGYRTFLEQDV